MSSNPRRGYGGGKGSGVGRIKGRRRISTGASAATLTPRSLTSATAVVAIAVAVTVTSAITPRGGGGVAAFRAPFVAMGHTRQTGRFECRRPRTSPWARSTATTSATSQCRYPRAPPSDLGAATTPADGGVDGWMSGEDGSGGDGDGDSARQLERLSRENEELRGRVEELEGKNSRRQVKLQMQERLILEQFEGEGAGGDDEEPCEVDYEERSGFWFATTDCPIEPNVTFKDALKSRAYWLVGLLALQSCSGFILSRNEALLQAHPVIIYFLTMLVGAGGNAGNQASVRVIRGIALGNLDDSTQSQFLIRELRMAFALSAILSVAGFIRAAVFRTPFAETVAITTALSLIVFSSICLGAILPLILKKIGVDPAHSSTTIQVVMDILGVLMTVAVSTAILDSSLGKTAISALASWGL